MDDRDIKNAAQICYAPNNARYLAPLIWVVEELVIPDGVTGYTANDIEKYIRLALQKRRPTPLALDGATAPDNQRENPR